MSQHDDAMLAYLRNINTRPGPNAGRSIDPTKPGPTADLITELERRIADYREMIVKAENKDAPLTPLGLQVLEARRAQVEQWEAELARLRNEQQPGWDSIVHELGECPTISCPAPSPGPQDVRDDDEFSRLDNFQLEYQRNYYRSMYKRADEAVEYWKQQAALAQSDAQPIQISRIIDRLRFCEDCLRAGVPDEYFGWAGDQPSLEELAHSDEQPDDPDLVAAKEHAARMSSEPPIIAAFHADAQPTTEAENE
jgi:hypothetical protein